MVETHRATYSSVPQTVRTSPNAWEVAGAGVLRDAVRSPAVLHSEGEIPESSVDHSAKCVDSPPLFPSGLEAHVRWFQMSEGEYNEELDGVKSETELVASSVEGWSDYSPSGAIFISPMAGSVRSPCSLGWKTQRRRGKIPLQAASTNGQSTSFVNQNSKFFPTWFGFGQSGDDTEHLAGSEAFNPATRGIRFIRTWMFECCSFK
ncbi:hypothetical protein B0H16DRAFT_1535116 [Mycena metata]|uniref:Uncharacterized protein n=1 Tax=Mycena metata TaxID=1033252 RepID=A0AAD7J7E4_9AGAR|nr:hypothetical protein B0H16DRAFT_1535116 [Mycena metata]